MDRDRALRDGLVSHLQRTNILRDPRVAAALSTVDRHRFVPAVTSKPMKTRRSPSRSAAAR